ncbi:MAG: YcjF family protein [Alphaproteobacteria bacterium]
MKQPEIFDVNDPSLSAEDYAFDIENLELENLDNTLQNKSKKAKGLALFGFLFSLLWGLLTLAFSLWVYGLYDKAKLIHPWLGWLTLGLSALIILTLIFITIKELLGLIRLSSVKKIRLKAKQSLENGQRDKALKVMHEISHLYQAQPLLQQARQKLQKESEEQLDSHAILTLTEEYLLTPLDQDAQKIIQQAGRQVAVSTALSRIMILDVIIVFFSAWRMIRQLAELYGMRPSKLSLWRLLGQIFTHLIITGGMAAGEDLLGSILGHSMAAKLSSRLGEGVINGLLTCRVGLVALDYCRPMPYLENDKPKLKDIAQTFLPKFLK